jgi:hypothetical protein
VQELAACQFVLLEFAAQIHIRWNRPSTCAPSSSAIAWWSG